MTEQLLTLMADLDDESQQLMAEMETLAQPDMDPSDLLSLRKAIRT